MKALFKMIRTHASAGGKGKKRSRTLTLFAKSKTLGQSKRPKKAVVLLPEFERPFAQA